MNSSMTTTAVCLQALRWLARVLSVLAVGIVLLFAFGEGLNLARFTPRELVMFVFFPLGVCLGMAAAWRWEGLGGGISVGSLAAFYLAARLMSHSFPRGFAFAAFTAPGFLFLACWLWTRWATKQRGV